MFCRKRLYLKMQKIHHKTLKVIYQSNKTYKELLELSEAVSIHQRQLRFLVTEIYKSTFYLNTKFISTNFRGSLIWNNLPNYIKSSRSVCEFKNNMKNFRDIDCSCYYYCFCFLCYYIQWLVFINDELF